MLEVKRVVADFYDFIPPTDMIYNAMHLKKEDV